MKDDERTSNFLLGVLVGGFIAGITALLFAPTSGKKLRKKISNKAEDFYEDAQEYIETGKEKADEMVQTVASDFSEIMKSLKKGMELAAKDGDGMTEDLLNATHQSIEKHQWMLNAFLGEGNK